MVRPASVPAENILQNILSLGRKIADDQLTPLERQLFIETCQVLGEYLPLFSDDRVIGRFIALPDGTLRVCNATFARLIGCASLDEALGSSMYELIAPSPHQDPPEDAPWYQEKATHEWSEVDLYRRDKTTVPVLMHVRSLVDKRGDIIELSGSLIDHSGWKEQYDAQIGQTQKMETLGRLAGGVVHDFNNLVTAITGYSQLALIELSDKDPVRRNIEQIMKAGDRAGILTQQLLVFSRRQDRNLQHLNLNDVITDMKPMMGRLISEDIEVVTVMDPTLGTVHADEGQIGQVLLNLAVNAHDAMSQGGVLTIETSNAELDEDYVRGHPMVYPGHYVKLVVRDTGCGMDAEVQAHLFEPFFTTKPSGEGTGLGLATVYDVVKKSDGYVWVHSELGQGTTFEVYLPRVDKVISTPSLTAPATPVPHGTETILMAEDDSTVLEIAALALRQHGYTVLEAGHGGEAMSLHQHYTGPIHLLVTDLVMPQLSGPDLARQLRTGRPGLRVLYITGYADRIIDRYIERNTGVKLLKKPFTGEVLARLVREILDASPSEGI